MLFCLNPRVRLLAPDQFATDSQQQQGYTCFGLTLANFFNLLTQNDQVRCFEHVAPHLTAGGLFAIEAYMPSYFHRLQNHQYVEAEAIEVDAVRLDLLRHDPATQMISESHISLSLIHI